MKKMRYLPTRLLLIIPTLIFISFAQEEEPEKDTTVVEEGPVQFIKKGDEAFEALDNQKALEFYSEAVKLEPVSMRDSGNFPGRMWILGIPILTRKRDTSILPKATSFPRKR